MSIKLRQKILVKFINITIGIKIKIIVLLCLLTADEMGMKIQNEVGVLSRPIVFKIGHYQNNFILSPKPKPNNQPKTPWQPKTSSLSSYPQSPHHSGPKLHQPNIIFLLLLLLLLRQFNLNTTRSKP